MAGLSIETESAAISGVYPLAMSHAAHIDPNNAVHVPDALAGGYVAVDTACPVPLIVDTTSDSVLTACTTAPLDCSLRGVITNANTFPGPDIITFSIAAGPQTIPVGSALPDVTGPTFIDGTTQPGCGSFPCVEVNGTGAGAGVDGLRLTGGSSLVKGLTVNDFGGNGIEVTSDGHTIVQNNITNNSGAGVDIASSSNAIGGLTGVTLNGPCTGDCNQISGNTLQGVVVTTGTGNNIRGNRIEANGALGIDLGTAGVTANDIPGWPTIPDTDSGANGLQNFPVIDSVLNKANVQTVVAGRLDSAPSTAHTYAGYHSASCDGSGNGEGSTYAGSSTGPALDMDGIGSASMLLTSAVTVGNYFTATATSPGGSTSEFSTCVQVATDVEGDGVQDSIDDGVSSFSDIPLGSAGDTFGSVTTTGGLSLSIVDDPNPEGVIIGAVGSGGPAEIATCGTGTLEISAGQVGRVNCGSATWQSKVGPLLFRIGTIATTMPSDTLTTLAVVSGVVNVTADGSNPRPIVVGGLTVLPGETVPVVDPDLDGLVNQVDPDDDGDLVADEAETNCGSDPLDLTPPLSRPERLDGAFAGVDDDGDTTIDEALPGGAGNYDCDGDGFKGSVEDHVYSYLPQTNGDQKVCQEYDTSFPGNPNPSVTPSRRWPADLNKESGALDSFNRVTLLDLTTLLAPIRYFGTDVGTNPADVRFDLVPGPGTFADDINIEDLIALLAGGSGFPPIYNYSRAFDGPPCPYTP
jgi:hypothetical protein